MGWGFVRPVHASLLLVGVLANPRLALADSFAVDDWFVSATVSNFNLGDDSEFFYTVQNPFNASHTATIAASTCQASYDFAWAEQFGTFLIQSTQTAEGVPTSMLVTDSSGYIYVTPSEALALTINAQWTFDLPVDYMHTTLLVRVFGAATHQVLFGQTTGGDTFPGEPASGTVTITGNAILPPGETWVLRYGMDIYTYGGTQGYMGTGNGYVNFQLSPEPASASVLTLGLLTLSHRRHCQAKTTRESS